MLVCLITNPKIGQKCLKLILMNAYVSQMFFIKRMFLFWLRQNLFENHV